MRLLYGMHYGARMRVVAEQVPAGASVLELCCGPGTLYRRRLRARTSSYVGLDVNQRFVRMLVARGVDARVCDLAAVAVNGAALPRADVVIMQASLYHFLPDARGILERMLAAADDCVIVSEPVRNLSASGIPLVGAIGRRAADPGVGADAGTGGTGRAGAERFTAASLEALMGLYESRIRRRLEIPGGREHVYVLNGG
ncbi:MAG: class I SAM-dependent methyltransferase [Solirubrobacteraceae bacterium]